MVESTRPLRPRPGVHAASAAVSTTTGSPARRPTGAQALPALLEPLRQAREGGVLALQVRAVEEALLREEEEQEGGHERLDARERGQGETTRHRDEPRRHDGEGVDRAEEERLDPGGGG